MAIAIANAFYLKGWESQYAALLPSSGYYRAEPVSTIWIFSFVIKVLTLWLVLLAGIALLRRVRMIPREVVILATGVLCLAFAAVHFLHFPGLFVVKFVSLWLVVIAGIALLRRVRVIPREMVILATGVLCVAFAATRFLHFPGRGQVAAALCSFALAGASILLRQHATQIARLIISGFAALFVAEAVVLGFLYIRTPSGTALADGPRAPLGASQSPKPHIIWMIYDEFDWELATSLRPASVEMPEFDRLRREGLSASDAHSPTGWTLSSIPAMTMGKRIAQAVPIGPHTLSLRLEGDTSRSVSWSSQPTVLSAAREFGLNPAIIGWHHPYCRVFGGLLGDCFWTPNVDATGPLRNDFAARQAGLDALVPYTATLSDTAEYKVVRQEHQAEYSATLKRALEAVDNPKLDLVLVHWMIPHPPGIYDRLANSLAHSADSDYLDNLELVDYTIGAVRARLEASRVWSDSTVVIVGDHPLREWIWSSRVTWTSEEASLSAQRRDPRVPFLIKLPHEHTPAVFGDPVDTVLIHDLILRWMQGSANTVESVVEYLREGSRRFPVTASVHGPEKTTD